MWPAGFKTGPTEMICVGRGTVNRPSKQMLKDLHWRHKKGMGYISSNQRAPHVEEKPQSQAIGVRRQSTWPQ